jgi:hypothetical protein
VTVSVLVSLAVVVPVDIDPDDARAAAAKELSDPAYRAAEPSFMDDVFTRIGRWFADVLSALGGGSGSVGLLVLLVLAIAVFAVIRLRVGRLGRARRAGGLVFPAGATHSAQDYRRAAESAAARGDFAVAVRERFRAIVRELEVRGVLDERSGRTVDECAAQAGQRLPDRAADLRAAATVFDDVVYGGRTATEAAYRDLAALDAGIQAARPVLAAW